MRKSFPMWTILWRPEFVYNMSFSDRDYERHMEDILEKGPSAVVFTFGSKGCRGLDKEGYFELPAFRVPVVDTVGAGGYLPRRIFLRADPRIFLKRNRAVCQRRQRHQCTCIGGRAGIPTPDITKKFLETGVIDSAPLMERGGSLFLGAGRFLPEVAKRET